MPRTVFCVKLQKELPGLEETPWPGELGTRIYNQVSAQAWKMWEDRMKMILNEYRLMPGEGSPAADGEADGNSSSAARTHCRRNTNPHNWWW